MMKLDWEILGRLREGFLRGSEGGSAGAVGGDYWESREVLAQYDATYAQRIGWKWLGVLRDLRRVGWCPRGERILDWGCGSGIATRAFLREGGAEGVKEILFWDRSRLAREFAREKVGAAFGGIEAKVLEEAPVGVAKGTILLVSHVVNELSEEEFGRLVELAREAEAVLWVEAGSSTHARRLVEARELLRGTHRVEAPCTFQGECPMQAEGNERHWCHQFAEPPAGLAAESFWAEFAKRAGVDLRSLAYSELVLSKKSGAVELPVAEVAGSCRLIGRAQVLKFAARCLVCSEEGLREVDYGKREFPEIYRGLGKSVESPLLPGGGK